MDIYECVSQYTFTPSYQHDAQHMNISEPSFPHFKNNEHQEQGKNKRELSFQTRKGPLYENCRVHILCSLFIE